MNTTPAIRTAPNQRGLRAQWRGARTVWKALVLVTLALVVLVTAFLFLGNLAPRTPAPDGSSFAASDLGYKGWKLVLDSYGWQTTRIQGPLDDAALNPDHTLVIASDRAILDDAEVQAIRGFVAQGGRLVAVTHDQPWLTALVGTSLVWSPNGVVEAQRLQASPIVDQVAVVTQDGVGSWSELPRGAQPLLGTRDHIVVAAIPQGSGTVIVIADTSMLANRNLVDTDNARFSLSVVGANRPVAFAEGIHGFDLAKRKGLNAIPVPWRLAGLGIVLAGIVLLVSRARRLGPPEERVRAMAPSRRRYLEAYAQTLAATRNPAESGANVQRTIRRVVAERTGIRAEDSDALFTSAAIRLGLSEDDIRFALYPLNDDRDLAGAVDVLARLAYQRSPA